VIVAVDVDYREAEVVTACVGFAAWTDAVARDERVVVKQGSAAAYEPGQFYRRELPYLVEAVRGIEGVEGVIVDGHVWLEADKPGLGAHLYEALGRAAWVVGVAKGVYRGGVALPVLRGNSRVALWVTAAGMETAEAAERVKGMSGPYRLPALLKRVDQLARAR
jgi:deoxyribonuclease V